MEGEFDRETYDDGWGSNGVFLTIREQLGVLEKTVQKLHDKKMQRN